MSVLGCVMPKPSAPSHLVVPPLSREAMIELRVKMDALICAGTNDTSHHGQWGNPTSMPESPGINLNRMIFTKRKWGFPF